jgi:plastocyanin
MGQGCTVGTRTNVETAGEAGVPSQAVPAPGSDAEEMIVEEDGTAEKEGGAMLKLEIEAEAEVGAGSGMKSEEAVVSYDGNGFSPANLAVKAGTRVTFRNDSSASFWPASNVHPTHQLLPGFDARQAIGAGGTYSFTFTSPGAWQYHNHLRAAQGGTITVTP